MKFELGQTVATPAAIEVLGRHGRSPMEFLLRHASGDWGDLDASDRKTNNAATDPKNPGRILSSCHLMTSVMATRSGSSPNGIAA